MPVLYGLVGKMLADIDVLGPLAAPDHMVCFADSLEAKARARHRLESGPSESRRLGGTESGPLVDGSGQTKIVVVGQTKIVPLRARLSDSF